MASPLVLLSAEDTAINLLGAINGIAPSAPQFRNSLQALASGSDSALAAQLSALYGSLSNQQYTTQVLNNLGVTPNTVPKASYDVLVEALNIFFGVYPAEARGQITLNLSRLLSGLTQDATYGAAARAWVAFKEGALEYAADLLGATPLGTNELQAKLGLSIAVNQPVVVEGNTQGGVLTFTVTLAKPVFGAPVTLNYATVDTTGDATQASAQSDYVPVAGTLTFLPGQSTATFTVAVRADTLVESDEMVRVTISGNLLSSPVTAVGKITNDDMAVTYAGRVVDGYVRGATVFVDYNNNDIIDSALESSTQTTTDASGSYQLTAPQAGGTLVAFGGVNVDTGNANTLILKAPARAGEINNITHNLTPLTSLIAEVIERSTLPGTPVTAEVIAAAENLVRASFNLGSTTASGISLLAFDPVAAAANSAATPAEKALALDVFKAGVQVALISAAAQGSASTSVAKNTAAAAAIDALADKITSLPPAGGTGTQAVSLSDATLVGALLATVLGSSSAASAAASAVASANGQVASAASTTAIATVQNKFEDDVNPVAVPANLQTNNGGTTTANKAPTGISVVNALTSVAENTSTTSRIKVADLAIIDDGLGTNTLSLEGPDAGAFEVQAGTLYLKAGTALNFEAKRSFSVSVVASDASVSGSSPVSASFSLAVTDVNEAPTGVLFSNTRPALAENTSTASRVKVADVAAADDALGTNTLTLGGADAGSFELDGGVLYLKAGTVLNGTTKASYQVTVTASDASVAGSSPVSAAFNLAVVDPNAAPTAVALSNVVASLPENSSTAARVKVADIAITDDGRGTNTITLGGADAQAFEVVGNQLFLKAGTALDFESKAAYSVTVSVADTSLVGAAPVTTNYSLALTNVNEAPVAGAAAVAALAENTTTVGTFAATDVDAGDTLAYSLTGTNAALFNINSQTGAVTFKTAPNFEADPRSYTFNVVATDAGGLAATRAVTVNVTNVNEAPVAGPAAAASVAENTSVVGTFAATDVDAGDTLTYSLTGTNAAAFNINSQTGAVTFRAAPNFEVDARSYSFNVVATDAAGLTATRAVTISVTNVNEAPVAGAAATVSTAENTTTVGTFAATDVDAGDTLTYSLTGTNAAAFNINSQTGAVTFKTAPNFEVDARSYTFNVVATDAGGLAATRAVTVNVTDVNEAPTAVALSGAVNTLSDATSTANRVKVATIAVSDDALGTNSVSLSGADAGIFEVVGNELFIKAGTKLDAATKANYAVTVSAADSSLTAAPVTTPYGLTITSGNVAPTISNVPQAVQDVRVGVAAALPDFTVADENSSNLSVTLLPTNGTISGLTDADPNAAGIQVNGTAAQINSALANAQFTAAAAGGAASIGISVSDGSLSASATYRLLAGAGTAAAPASASTGGNDFLDGTRGSVGGTRFAYDLSGGDDTVLIDIESNSNLDITGLGAGDMLVFRTSQAAAKAFYSVSDNGSDVILTANVDGIVQRIALIGIAGSRDSVGGAIDNIDELVAFLGSAVGFGG